MKVGVSKIKFYGIFLWRKTNNPPEYIENLLSVSVDIAIRLNTWFSYYSTCSNEIECRRWRE